MCLYKVSHLINMPCRNKNIIWNEFTESLLKLYYTTF